MFVDKKKIKREDDPNYVTDEEISDETMSSMTSSSGDTLDEEQGQCIYFIHCSRTLKLGYIELGSEKH